jgi:hypothetical protein
LSAGRENGFPAEALSLSAGTFAVKREIYAKRWLSPVFTGRGVRLLQPASFVSQP